MVKNFMAYDLAVQLYKQVVKLEVPSHSRDQLFRAAQSVALNLAEGAAKPSVKDKHRFYAIAFGSLREVQSLFDLLDVTDAKLLDLSDHIAACLYKIVYVTRKPGP